MVDVFTKSKRREIMQAVKRQHTAPEEKFASFLRRLGFSFRRHPKHLPGTPDFYLPRKRLAIFVNGCFWHGHRRCPKGRNRPKTRKQYWEQKIASNQRRDRRDARRLRAMGLSVYTVWECEIRQVGIPARLLARLTGSPAVLSTRVKPREFR
ncbi:MAG TPA: very short patch repair endonuclease [Phycisphaerae bacterium]|nr:very short patch repair endonuclease [Phycisphaerae bacterium]